jgi:hypothetical protein
VLNWDTARGGKQYGKQYEGSRKRSEEKKNVKGGLSCQQAGRCGRRAVMRLVTSVPKARKPVQA